MLDESEWLLLGEWCTQRGVVWRPAPGPALMLMPRPGRDGAGMLLVRRRGELRLRSATGEMLASASGLHAPLDALDGGVGGPAQGWTSPVRPV